MNWKTFRICYLGLAAAAATLYPGGTVLITESGEMIEIGSPLWFDRVQLDRASHLDPHRIINKLQFAELAGGSPEELPPIDWYQPLSEPIFDQDAVQYPSFFMPVA